AAEYLRVCKATVYKLIKSGKLPAVRAGRQIRIARCNIDKMFLCNASKSDKFSEGTQA
ncbi:MAG: helix-turn-helix domain-containing protein, partial [Huintestinicola sp.]